MATGNSVVSLNQELRSPGATKPRRRQRKNWPTEQNLLNEKLHEKLVCTVNLRLSVLTAVLDPVYAIKPVVQPLVKPAVQPV